MICHVCQNPVGDDAKSPSWGTVHFHPGCLEVVVRQAPSRRNRSRRTVSVRFARSGISYAGAAELKGDVDQAIQSALDHACRWLLAGVERTHRGGHNKGNRVACMKGESQSERSRGIRLVAGS